MLYIARHGQTVWNAENKVCGITDVKLTTKGIEQAMALAYEFFDYTLENGKLEKYEW